MTLTRRDVLRGGAGAAGLLLLGSCQRGVRRHDADVRAVSVVVDAQPTIEGAGVHLRRALGSAQLSMLDPFLLLDDIDSTHVEDFAPGFPRHPHRGFETVSYVLEGSFEHADSMGNHGSIHDGGAQWMTAGRGIVHQEMPTASPRGALRGLQLWVNLPAASKWIAPRYQDLEPSRIARTQVADATVRIVAGEVAGVRGPVDGIVTAPVMLDVELAAGARFEHALPADHTAFVYALAGTLTLAGGPQGTALEAGQLAALGPGRRVVAASTTGGRALLVAAAPIREPVARRGPFVMTTEAELRQAFDDYRSGRLAGG